MIHMRSLNEKAGIAVYSRRLEAAELVLFRDSLKHYNLVKFCDLAAPSI